MPKYLLLGAGFSRNWGGWLAVEVFEWLLGHPNIRSDATLRSLLWKHQQNGNGFEAALSEVQASAASNPPSYQSSLDAFQAAIDAMFDEMNNALHVSDFDFSNQIDQTTRSLLVQFDAIFTLNQDTLLEHAYCNDNVGLANLQKWSNACLPGMIKESCSDTGQQSSWAHWQWKSREDGKIQFGKREQPIYKLHGSSNWRDSKGSSLLVMGGSKSFAIDASPILKAYAAAFEAALCAGDAKLMIIGYGFRDQHINDAIVRGTQKGLSLFNSSPQGSSAATDANPQKKAPSKAKTAPWKSRSKAALPEPRAGRCATSSDPTSSSGARSCAFWKTDRYQALAVGISSLSVV